MCLEREKKRSSELKALVAKLQSKVKETSQGIEQCLGQAEMEEVSGERLRVIERGMEEARVKLLVSGLSDPANAISSLELKSLLEGSNSEGL